MFANSLLRTADWKLSNCGKCKKGSLIWHVVLKGKFHFRVRITRRSIKMWNRKIFCCVQFVKGTYFTRVVLIKIATKLTRKKFKILNWYFGLDIKKKKERKRIFQTHLPDETLRQFSDPLFVKTAILGDGKHSIVLSNPRLLLVFYRLNSLTISHVRVGYILNSQRPDHITFRLRSCVCHFTQCQRSQ